jgi:predicted phosphodiesterase
MIIDCISDLHGYYPKLEGGDLLIVAGDLTRDDSMYSWHFFYDWLAIQEYKSKIFISGNHDNRLQKNNVVPNCDIFRNITYLCDSGTEFEYIDIHPYTYDEGPHSCANWSEKSMQERHGTLKKLKIWGSPWTKTFEGMNPHCKAFTVDTEEELSEKWALIPSGIDILVTHSPSCGVLDTVRRYGPFSHEREESAGSESLIKPMIKSGCRLHVFGHIHEAYGKFHNCINGITYVNASHVNERYQPVNKPIRIVL